VLAARERRPRERPGHLRLDRNNKEKRNRRKERKERKEEKTGR